MTPLQQIATALGWNLRINENFVTVSPAGMYGRDPSTTTGLTWGYLGGNFSGVVVASGTVALTASSTNYVVANRTTGVVSVATTTTNWLATGTFLQLYQAVAGASTVTSYDDFRQAIGGASGGGGGMSNPMTTTGDIIYSSSGSTPARLGVGANGFVLTLAAGIPTWSAASSGGFTNPMTTAGDLILGGAAGAPGRLAIGTTGQVLTVSGGVVGWATSGGSGFTGGTLSSALNEAAPVTIASAASVAIGAAAANSITITGTTAITSFDIIAAGALRHVTFSGVLVLTYDPALMILPGSASITTAVGDVAEMVSLGAGNWKCNDFVRASGTALVSAGGGGLTGFTSSVNSTGLNVTVTASIMQASGAATNIDGVFSGKGQGAVQAQVSDGTATGGNKRGNNSADWQTARATATAVASGSYSFIGSGYNNEASGPNCCVVTGDSNKSQNTGGILCGSANITANGNYNAVLCGNNNSATGGGAAVLAGDNNTADGNASTAFGTRCTVRGMIGAVAHAGAPASSYAQGGRQRRMNTLQADTANATATAVTVDGGAGNALNQFKLVADSGLKVRGQIGVRNITTGNCGFWEISGACKNIGGTVSLSGSPVISAFMGDAALSACAVAIIADTSRNCLQVTVTGLAATSLIWLAELTTIEIVS